MIYHNIHPVYDKDSAILILGSFPSEKSREHKFFYAHNRNRFWKVISQVLQSEVPQTVEEKKEFLYKYHIALWDVIASCTVHGSADSTIKDVTPNDLSVILKESKIKKIFVNGKTALKYYNKYTRDIINQDAVCLPSTSPANAAFSIEELVREWGIIKESLI